MGDERDMYFLSKNYLSADDTVNVSSGTLLKVRLYDQKYNLQWASASETSESDYSTYIEIIFKEGLVAINRTIDTFILQNINLKDFKIQYFTGGSYAEISSSEAIFTTNTATSKRIKLTNSITTSKIKILMKATIVANQEKKIGEFWACLETYRLVAPFTTRNRKDISQSGFNRLGDGTGTKWFEYNKWGKTYQLKNLTDTQLKALEDIYRLHSVFTFYENYTRDIDLIKLVFWIGNFSGSDNPKIDVELNSLDVELTEK